ncbi:MAG: hypothetical protein GY885_04285, partial [Phycisphaeraceae bacterium]|nr:hypothetical protein [Phycisphaeraceae bacterium]
MNESRLKNYVFTAGGTAALAAAGGLVGHAEADIIGSITPQAFDTSTYSQAFFFGNKIIIRAQSSGVKFERNGGRFAVKSTL